MAEDYGTGQTNAQEDPGFANDDMFTAQTQYFVGEFGPQNSGGYLDAARQSLAVVEAARKSMTTGKMVQL